jgi:hypothetical protein
VLEQIKLFVGQLDQNKSSIVAALENTDRLASELRQQDGTIKATLDDLPAALRSINGQRADLVKMLKALTRLSGVGVRVIQASKESTINSLRDLAPVLDGFAKAGQSFPKSLQVFLTYPFVDEAVGRNPRVARNLHMGDYTNLSVNLDIDVADLKLPGAPAPVCAILGQVLAQTRTNVTRAVNGAMNALPDTPLITRREKRRLRRNLTTRLLNPALAQAEKQCKAVNPGDLAATAQKLLPGLVDTLNILTPAQVKQLVAGTLGSGGSPLGNLPGTTLPGVGLPRADLGAGYQKTQPLDPFGLSGLGLDPGIGTMLLQGVADVR